MSLDLTLLRLLKDKAIHGRLRAGIPEAGLDETTHQLVRDIDRFYKEFPDAQRIDIKNFKVWWSEFLHASMPDDKAVLYRSIIDHMAEDVPAEMMEGMAQRLLTVEAAMGTLGLVQRFNEGAEIDFLPELESMIASFNDRMLRKTKLPRVEHTPDELFQPQEEGKAGISFRLDTINRSFRPMVGGDFGIAAGRPDRGKTTFLASESSFWIPQLDAVWPGEDRVGLWLNNEGSGHKIKKRYFQAALGLKESEMVDLMKKGQLMGALQEQLGDDLGRMQFFDIHDMYSHEVEAIIKQTRPGFIIFDMIDHIKFTGGLVNGGSRTDQILEEMYKWGRNIAVKHDCIGIATSQISAEGDGEQFPPMSALKDSKTGKQGACDFILMLGALNDPAMDGYRWIGAPKNKLHREGGPKDPRGEVLFRPDIARVIDPEQ